MSKSKQELATFNFTAGEISQAVRVVWRGDAPWFVGRDVCLALGFPLAHRSPAGYLRALGDDEKGIQSLDTPGGSQPCTVISESGLYKLIMRSDKPQARVFQDWVTRIVLPAIRKDCAYVAGEEKVATGEISEDEFILKAMTILQGKVTRITAERDVAVARVAVPAAGQCAALLLTEGLARRVAPGVNGLIRSHRAPVRGIVVGRPSGRAHAHAHVVASVVHRGICTCWARTARRGLRADILLGREAATRAVAPSIYPLIASDWASLR